MHLLRVYCLVSPAILERVHFWSRRVTQRDGISKPLRETRTFRHQILMWLSVTDISISCSLRVFTTGNTPQGGEANLPTKKIQNNIEEKNPNVLQKVWKETGQWLWSNPLCTDTVSKRWTRIVVVAGKVTQVVELGNPRKFAEYRPISIILTWRTVSQVSRRVC